MCFGHIAAFNLHTRSAREVLSPSLLRDRKPRTGQLHNVTKTVNLQQGAVPWTAARCHLIPGWPATLPPCPHVHCSGCWWAWVALGHCRGGEQGGSELSHSAPSSPAPSQAEAGQLCRAGPPGAEANRGRVTETCLGLRVLGRVPGCGGGSWLPQAGINPSEILGISSHSGRS